MPSLRSIVSGNGDNDVTVAVRTTSDNSGIDETNRGLKTVGDTADDTGGHLSGMSNVAKIAIAAVGASVVAMGSKFVQSAADLQQTSKSFEVLTGNVEVANGLFAQLAVYANTTPFEFPEIAKAGQTLLGFGISSDKIYGDIQMLGDIAAATGADFGSLALVFSQVNATGHLMGQDALQLINNRIPIFNILGKKMGLTAGEVKKKMEEGAIGVDLFNEALSETTQKGGFAFNGVNTLAQTFNGRMSTLSDTVLDFGRNLIGVKIDPKLGLVIQQGGLFDQLSNALPKIASGLSAITPILSGVIGAIVGLVTGVVELGKQMADYLEPHFASLWTSIQDNLVPVLEFLWHNIIEPLAPVLATVLAVAIGVVTDAVTALVNAFGWVIQQIQAGNPWVIALTAAFVGLAGAMAFNAIFDALKVGFTVLQLITIPNVMASITALKVAIMTPTVMGAIGVAGVLADIALVMAAVVAVQNAIQAMNDAAKAKSSLDKTNQDLKASAAKAYASGDKAKGDKLMNAANSNNPSAPSWIDQFMTGTLGKFSDGGYTGSGGVNEIAGVVHKGEFVLPQTMVDQSTGTPKAMGGTTISYVIQNLNLNGGEAVQEFFEVQDRNQFDISRNLTGARGQA